MKIYVRGDEETLDDVFRRMIASAKSDVKVYYPFEDKVFIAEKKTTVEDLQKAMGDSYSRYRMNAETAKKFLIFWELVQKMTTLNQDVRRNECRNNKEWVELNSRLHSAYKILNLGGWQGGNFILYFVTNTTNIRSVF